MMQGRRKRVIRMTEVKMKRGSSNKAGKNEQVDGV